MKKTIIALTALCGVAAGDTILTFAGNNYTAPEWATDSCDAHNVKESIGATLSDATSFTLTWSTKGNTYISPDTVSWSNTTALTEMNSVLGTVLTTNDVSNLVKTCPGNNATGNTVLTLNFENSSYAAGDAFTAYVMLGQFGNSMNSFTVTGLTDAAISYATATGDGYVTTASFSGQGAATLVKVTGTLTESTVAFSTNGHKVGYSMLATKIIPEPTTATLSLLALAGLAARRRRR